MIRLLYPLIFSMAFIPDSEKHLENLHSIAQVTQSTIKNIKDGLDGFHSNVIQLHQIFNQQNVQK